MDTSVIPPQEAITYGLRSGAISKARAGTSGGPAVADIATGAMSHTAQRDSRGCPVLGRLVGRVLVRSSVAHLHLHSQHCRGEGERCNLKIKCFGKPACRLVLELKVLLAATNVEDKDGTTSTAQV